MSVDLHKNRMTGSQLQLIVQAVSDRLFGVQGVDSNITSDSIIPADINGLDAIIERDIHRTISQVEGAIKLDLYPKRKTNFAKTAKDVYENREFFNLKKPSFKNPLFLLFPTWNDLTLEQQNEYGNNTLNYINGSLDWDLLTPEQKELFSQNVVFVPNKSNIEEAHDGKERKYFTLFKRNIIKVHRLYMEIPNPGRIAVVPYIYREYNANEYFVYNEDGGLHLFPAQVQLEAIKNTPTLYNTSGLIPRLPQIMHVDYTYGLLELPEDLIDAIAMLAAIKIFETVNICLTQGLLSYSVQGFTAAFGKGMYADVMERYEKRANAILMSRYNCIINGAW